MTRPIASIILDEMNGAPSAPIKKVKKEKQIVQLTEEQLERKRSMIFSLKVGVWIVEFFKVDGTPAIMECTLDPKQIPHNLDEINPTLPDHRLTPDHLIRVFAIDRNGWRSFSIPNVTKFYLKIESI